MVALLVAQALAFAIVLVRLAAGARRPRSVQPLPEGLSDATVTVVVPTLNEADRIGPCLIGLSRQGSPVTEILIVDSGSGDGTVELVQKAALDDPRIRLLRDPPLAEGWIGKVWALQHALGLARGDWILGIDADVEPLPGAVAATVAAARQFELDMVSFGPRFAEQSLAERWLHPSLLLTLVYRAGPPSVTAPPKRVIANGQCFLAARSLLARHGGYGAARDSFADDVKLARHYARLGARVGFLDGSKILRLRAYRSIREMWREWGRSLDLSDATPKVSQWTDIAVLLLVQGVPIPLLLASAFLPALPYLAPVLWLNGAILLVRTAMLLAIAPAYERRGLPFWLSPLSDPAAAVRVLLSTLRRPRSWRGRVYDLPRPGRQARHVRARL